MSIAQSPGIDVLEDTIKLTLDAGEPTELVTMKVPPRDYGGDDNLLGKVFEPVREAVLLREFGYPADAITLSGPFYIRPIPEAPMELVTRVIRLMRMAGQESVLAWRDGATWRIVPRSGLPESIEAPLAPMPYGTGAGADGLTFVAGSEHPTGLAMLVAKDAIWVGLEGGDHRQLPNQNGGYDWKGLAAALRDYRARPALAKGASIEIAAAADVEYRHLVPALLTASQAGFDEWTLHSSTALSVQFR